MQELHQRTNQPVLLTGALLVVTTNTIFLKIVCTLIFDFERQLKVKVDEVGLLLTHLYGYNSVSILKPATPLRLPRRWNWGLVLALKTHII